MVTVAAGCMSASRSGQFTPVGPLPARNGIPDHVVVVIDRHMFVWRN
jgi:hypothetical protein